MTVMSQRVYYNPPSGSEPLTFASSGSVKNFLPQDQIWKKVFEEYSQGIIMHPTLGVPKMDPYSFKGQKNYDEEFFPQGKPLEKKGVRKVWVVDKEKTKDLKQGLLPKPRNYIDCTSDDLAELGKAEYLPLSKFLKRSTDLDAEQRNELDNIRARHEEDIAEMEKGFEARKRKLAREMEQHKLQEQAMKNKRPQGIPQEGEKPPSE